MRFENIKKSVGSACVVVLLASSVLGCTAIAGGDPIGNSNRTAWTFGFISGLLVLTTIGLYFLRNRKGRLVTVLSSVLLLIHPAWTVSAWGGDCGNAKVNYSEWFTGFLALLTIYQGIRWMVTRHATRGYR